MKNLFAAALAGLVLTSGVALAQTCTTPAPYNLNAGEGLTGDTCTGTNIAGQLCGGLSSNEKDIFYQVTLGAGYSAPSIDFSTTSGTYQGILVLYTGACANGGPPSGCATAGFSPGAGQGFSMSLTSSPTQGGGPVPAGTYFMDVSAPQGGGCGPYTLSFTGTLPVKLQTFSVQ